MCKHLAFNIFYSFHDVTGNSVYLIFMYLQSGQCNSCDYLTTMENRYGDACLQSIELESIDGISTGFDF